MTHIGRAVTSTVGQQQMAGQAAVMFHYYSISAQSRGMFTVTGRLHRRVFLTAMNTVRAVGVGWGEPVQITGASLCR